MAETTLYSENPSMFRNNPIGFIVTILLCLVGVGLVILLVWWLRSKATLLTVTDERTILRKGILSKSVNEVWHRDVRNVQLKQTFVGIRDPDGVKDIIDAHKMASDD
jgi:uncharacterized membrane protein YdbT with pleckstrin-like domain